MGKTEEFEVYWGEREEEEEEGRESIIFSWYKKGEHDAN